MARARGVAYLVGAVRGQIDTSLSASDTKDLFRVSQIRAVVLSTLAILETKSKRPDLTVPEAFELGKCIATGYSPVMQTIDFPKDLRASTQPGEARRPR